MSVFVDTSALYALLVRTEEDHDIVVDAFSGLLKAHRRLVSTNYVLLETCALLQHRFGLAAVRDFENRLVPLLGVHWVDEGLHRRALERLFSTDRRGLSLVDSVSFVLMEAEGIQEALALDQDFEDQGFQVIPTRRGER
ncbi:MAG: PIN domain-containing protein [Gemmatimonadota bacterium]|nr:MAG: PIN domain-containing protein [Gemmatimonadota bacterium]